MAILLAVLAGAIAVDVMQLLRLQYYSAVLKSALAEIRDLKAERPGRQHDQLTQGKDPQ